MKADVSKSRHLIGLLHQAPWGRAGMILALLMVATTQLLGQTVTVNGTVTDSSDFPVIGAAVQVEGTTNGVITDLDGHYTLENVASDATLVFSYVGMVTQKIPVNGQSDINVKMADDNVMLEETVVIGYGTIKKSDLTGAVAVDKTDDFKNR